MNLAEAVTDCVVADYGEKWSDSDIRTYLNAMLHYVAGEAFTQPWDNVVLSSITAVIMKGEDWEGLFRFMVSKGMRDYRYAFGLYGALNGFANLTRDFTDILFASGNKQYVRNVYKEIHRQLTGVELNEVMPEVNRPLSEDIRESKIVENEPVVNTCNTFEYIKRKFEDAKVTNIKGYKLKELECAYREAKGELVAMVEILEDKKGWKNGCRRLLDEIGKSSNKVAKVTEKHQQQAPEPYLNFQDEPSQHHDFYNDTLAYNHIYHLLENPEELKQVKNDLYWFQQNYKNEYWDSKKGQYEKGRYADSPKDNESVIRHFEKYLKDKKKSDKYWLQRIYANIDIDKIISELKKIYS